ERVRSVAAAPQALAQDDGLGAAWLVVSCGESAAEERPGAETVKEICRDGQANDLLGFAVAGDCEAICGDGIERLEGAIARPPVQEVRHTRGSAFHTLLGERVKDNYQTFRVGVRQ